jgi:hypothetical protein
MNCAHDGCRSPARNGWSYCAVHDPAKPKCKGMTIARPATLRQPEIPARPCSNPAREGRDYCAVHEPDEEFNAARREQNLLSIGRHGGWHDGSSVLTGYIRDVDRWKKNPMHGAGL